MTGKKEPVESQILLTIGRVTIAPGDIIFGNVDGVVVIPKARVRDVADQVDKLGRAEAAARERIVAGEKLQAVWPARV